MKIRTALLVLTLIVMAVVAVWRPWRSSPAGPGATFATAAALATEQGHIAAAVGNLRQAVLAEPGNGSYHADLGNLYLEQGQYEFAASQLEIAAHLNPERPHIYCLLSQALVQLRRRGEALDSLKIALQKTPSCPHALAVRAEQFLRDDNLKAALADFRRVIEVAPQDPLAYQKAGFILYQTNQDDEARRLLERGLAVNPANPGSHLLLAQIYLRGVSDANSAALAEQNLQAATRDNPEADRAYAALGQLYRRRGDLSAARKAYQQALARAPTSEEALYGLSQVAQDQGDAPGAKRYLARFQRARRQARQRAALIAQAGAQPDNVALRLKIARLALAEDALPVAERMLNQAIGVAPADRQARELRAELFSRQGKAARASREFALASRLPLPPRP